jgi:hypothetical protein
LDTCLGLATKTKLVMEKMPQLIRWQFLFFFFFFFLLMKIFNATSCGFLDVCHNPFVEYEKKEAKASGKKTKILNWIDTKTSLFSTIHRSSKCHTVDLKIENDLSSIHMMPCLIWKTMGKLPTPPWGLVQLSLTSSLFFF